ncbi:hypothetical protein HK102_004210 [Quaeritorhiza haematococci]|nr:hypothetical protein HK102_004210 [Quaeritorhiza haematococci]
MRVFTALVALASVAALHCSASPVDIHAQQAPEQLTNPAEPMPEETVNEPAGPEQDEMDMYAPDAVADEEGYPFAEYPEWMDTAATDDDELSAAGPSYGRGFGYGGLKGYRGFKSYPRYRSFVYAPRFKKFIIKRVGSKKGSFGKSSDMKNA